MSFDYRPSTAYEHYSCQVQNTRRLLLDLLTRRLRAEPCSVKDLHGPSGPYNPQYLPLTPGTRLGIYEVIAHIGEGGMGQGDAERLARFTREAQTLASLSHPTIAHIHGFEEADGVIVNWTSTLQK
jgi:hypothetical protein